MLKIVLMSLLFSLFSCGGGSSSSSGSNSPSADNSMSFVLLDSPIKGIAYECDSKTFKTSSDGVVKCKDFPITFYLGDIELGTINKKIDKYILPQDLLGLSRNDFYNTKLIELVQLLQTLDQDDNPDNGLDIVSLTGYSKKFLDLSLSELDQIYVNQGKSPKSKSDSISHLMGSIKSHVTQCNKYSDFHIGVSKNSDQSFPVSQESLTLSTPYHGVATVYTVNDKYIVNYKPNPNYIGSDHFVYNIGQCTHTIYVQVNDDNKDYIVFPYDGGTGCFPWVTKGNFSSTKKLSNTENITCDASEFGDLSTRMIKVNDRYLFSTELEQSKLYSASYFDVDELNLDFIQKHYSPEADYQGEIILAPYRVNSFRGPSIIPRLGKDELFFFHQSYYTYPSGFYGAGRTLWATTGSADRFYNPWAYISTLGQVFEYYFPKLSMVVDYKKSSDVDKVISNVVEFHGSIYYVAYDGSSFYLSRTSMLHPSSIKKSLAIHHVLSPFLKVFNDEIYLVPNIDYIYSSEDDPLLIKLNKNFNLETVLTGKNEHPDMIVHNNELLVRNGNTIYKTNGNVVLDLDNIRYISSFQNKLVFIENGLLKIFDGENISNVVEIGVGNDVVWYHNYKDFLMFRFYSSSNDTYKLVYVDKDLDYQLVDSDVHYISENITNYKVIYTKTNQTVNAFDLVSKTKTTIYAVP